MKKSNPNVELSSFPSVCDSVMRWLAYEKPEDKKRKNNRWTGWTIPSLLR